MNQIQTIAPPAAAARPAARLRPATIALIGFLTLVDLFATQAILPSLAQIYAVTPAQIGIAANATTLGMAIAGLAAGAIGARLERKQAISISLALLAVPTAMLAFAPNLAIFALLRVTQGLFMATAFTLTIAYLSEKCTVAAATSALAAYVTGGVASNLVGRLTAAVVAGLIGAEQSFLFFALLNVAGAGVVALALTRADPMEARSGARSRFWSAWVRHLSDARLRCAFVVGFLILFGFIGTFTYVGFVLMAPPIALSMTALGFAFLVFLPSMLTTPFAGAVARRFGTGRTLAASLALALAGLLLLLPLQLGATILGMALVGIGTFFAQAIATGYVGRTAMQERAAASGLYLSAYYCGGLAGAAVIGQLFDIFGWNAAVGGIFAALALAGLLALSLRERVPA